MVGRFSFKFMAKNFHCLNCENKADIYQFCGRCFFRLDEATRSELERSNGESWLAAWKELDGKEPVHLRGFINGKPFWEMFYQVPVSKHCTIRLEYTGSMSKEGINKLIEMLEVSKEKFV